MNINKLFRIFINFFKNFFKKKEPRDCFEKALEEVQSKLQKHESLYFFDNPEMPSKIIFEAEINGIRYSHESKELAQNPFRVPFPLAGEYEWNYKGLAEDNLTRFVRGSRERFENMAETGD